MSAWLGFYRSSIGAKAVQAVTGALLFAFLVAHLSGNLRMYAGPGSMNGYAAFLKSKPALLWGARLGLLGAALVHIYTGVRLADRNRQARPVPYAVSATVQATVHSLQMVRTGLLVLAYVIFHLAHCTWGWIRTDAWKRQETIHVVDASSGLVHAIARHDVYSMTVLGFREWWISGLYFAAMLLLASHLAHGIPSFFQTLGWGAPELRNALRRGGAAVALAIALGFLAVPVGVLAGWIGLPAGASQPRNP